MKCRICGYPIQKKTHLNAFQDFTGYVYTCLCPVYWLDELSFLEKHNITLSEEPHYEIIVKKLVDFNTKKRVLRKNNLVPLDFFHGWYKKLKYFDPENKEGNSDKKSLSNTIKDLESSIWRFFYDIKNTKYGKDKQDDPEEYKYFDDSKYMRVTA